MITTRVRTTNIKEISPPIGVLKEGELLVTRNSNFTLKRSTESRYLVMDLRALIILINS
jgi:hypothetical protein